MNLIEYAKKEIELLDWTDDKEIYNGLLSKSVLELVKTFSKQGHSGASASVVLYVFNKIVKYEPLTPLTKNKNEWYKVENGVFQSKRNPSCFSDDNLKHYYDLNDCNEDGTIKRKKFEIKKQNKKKK